MAKREEHQVTRLLGELHSGRENAANELAELVYTDLLRVAEGRMRGRPAQTLEPAGLVNECWIRLADQHKAFESRSQFMAVASRIMLRVLVDAERRRSAARRGGDRQRVTLSFEIAAMEAEASVQAEVLAEALERLNEVAPRKAEVARLRGLVGLSIAETAMQLAISEATIERDWSFARAWLSREVQRIAPQLEASASPPAQISPDS